MSDIESSVFPAGAPRDSMLDVHNNNLFARGQIVAVSLANGRPVPNLFHENIFNLMVTKNNTDLLKSVLILFWKNGYTGVINVENVDNILGAIMVSISSRRILYLNKFLRGLKEALLENKTLLRSLFINSLTHP